MLGKVVGESSGSTALTSILGVESGITIIALMPNFLADRAIPYA
ncbi:hypothetical protein [Candidatus Ruthia endofausta]|nr:hypothetical protein [Candidatus Ruthia endofausta]